MHNGIGTVPEQFRYLPGGICKHLQFIASRVGRSLRIRDGLAMMLLAAPSLTYPAAQLPVGRNPGIMQLE